MIESKLAEYQSLRTEIGRRSDLQNQVLNLYVLSVAGGAALIGTNLSSQALLLALGIVGPIFGYWYFDQALGIETIGRYLAGDVEPSINRTLEHVEAHLRWERGFRVADPSIRLAIQNLQMLQILSFLSVTVLASALAIIQFSKAVSRFFAHGDIDTSFILVLYLVPAFYLGRSLYWTYLNWVYLVKNRRSALNNHAVRRFMDFTFTAGVGAVVTSFTPMRFSGTDNSATTTLELPPPSSGTSEFAGFRPLTPIEQLTSPEKREAMTQLSRRCLEKYQGKIAIQVDSLEEQEANEAVLEHIKAIVGFSRSPEPDYLVGMGNDVAVQIEFSPTTGSTLEEPLKCLGIFTIRNEEVTDLTDSTLKALQSLLSQSSNADTPLHSSSST